LHSVYSLKYAYPDGQKIGYLIAQPSILPSAAVLIGSVWSGQPVEVTLVITWHMELSTILPPNGHISDNSIENDSPPFSMLQIIPYVG
jgi:hypothetical protein